MSAGTTSESKGHWVDKLVSSELAEPCVRSWKVRHEALLTSLKLTTSSLKAYIFILKSFID